MAWQSPSPMGNGGAPGAGEHNGPAGTEYTLQGVMRFLQMEWHNHERARNSWDIERAEMKRNISKMESEHHKRAQLNQQLERQIRMLELALKNERAKNKARQVDDQSKGEDEAKNEMKGIKSAPAESKAGMLDVKPPNKPHNSFLDTETDPKHISPDEEDDTRDNSKNFARKCVEEMTYLLMAPTQGVASQPSLQSLANSFGNLNQAEAPMSLEEVYRQQRQKDMNFQQSIANHQPPPVPSINDMNPPHSSQPPQQPTFMTREPSNPSSQTHGVSRLPSDQQQNVSHPPSNFSGTLEEQVEKVTHSYDGLGRPITNQIEEQMSNVPHHAITTDTVWNFDEKEPNPTSSLDPSRRPDTDAFPSANSIPAKSPPRAPPGSHRRKSSGSTGMARRRSQDHETREGAGSQGRTDPQNFTVRFALRGHLDVVRSVIFTGGGSPSEPEICTAGDDGMIKRWIIPASYGSFGQNGINSDLDIQSFFTHRGHEGIVTSLAACPATASFATGGRVSGDGWIFSGGQDATVRVWERGRVDPKATLDGHTDAVWSVCVLPATALAVFGNDSNNIGGPDRVLLASGSADGTIKIWAVSAPPQLASPQTGSRRGVGGSRRHSVTSGSNYPSSPQPSVATSTPFHYTLVHSIQRPGLPSPTCISPLSLTGETFVVSFNDSSIIIFDTRNGEEMIGMASTETYDGTPRTGINSVVATSVGLEFAANALETGRILSDDDTLVHGATGSTADGGVEGVVISGHEDQFIRFFDANSGQCTYSMLAHPAAISSLSLSKDGREAVSAGHDASIRFWSLEKRICTQEITSHRIMRGEGVCSVVWSQDGRLVVSAGGDGVVKVFAR